VVVVNAFKKSRKQIRKFLLARLWEADQASARLSEFKFAVVSLSIALFTRTNTGAVRNSIAVAVGQACRRCLA